MPTYKDVGSETFLSPEQVKSKRSVAQALLGKGMDTSPVGHWTQALARVAQGGLGGYEQGSADQGERDGRRDVNARLTKALTSKAPLSETATSLMGNPWSEEAGQDMAVTSMKLDAKQAADDPNKDYRVRAEQAEANGLQRGSTEWKSFVLTGKMPSAASMDDTPESRALSAQKFGLDPNSDAGRSYILTGRLPREDQQMLTATDKKAILEADESVLQTQGAITSLKRAKELSKKAYDGATANERAWVTSQFGSEAGEATRELKQTVTEGALQQLKAIFGGMPTEGERKVLLEVQGSAELPQAVRERIYDRAIGLAENRMNFNRQRAGELRGGTFYKPEGGATMPTAEGGDTPSPAPSGLGGAPIRAKNKETGEVIEWNGSEWVTVPQ
jgi:hypothetical protein